MKKLFCIKWLRGYVTKNNSNGKPYTFNKNDPDTKTWTSRKNAEKFLSLKDKSWANNCTIEEV